MTCCPKGKGAATSIGLDFVCKYSKFSYLGKEEIVIWMGPMDIFDRNVFLYISITKVKRERNSDCFLS